MAEAIPTAEELAEEAERLRREVGDAPEPHVWTPELAAWFDRYGAAADVLVELAQGDAQLLRTAAGPVVEVGRRSAGGQLLITAAIEAEKRSRPGPPRLTLVPPSGSAPA